VVAQRLARTICPACATKYYPADHVLSDAGLTDKAGRPFRKGQGCPQCHDTGYRGRVGVYEVMEVTPDIRRMIHRAAPGHELREKCREQGQLSLRDEGILLALDGKSSLEEVLSVTHDDSDKGTPKHEAPAAAAPPARKEVA
jgi:type II secretory ATPase GspE/PulE/Tfp pilus assembly ATPase PilB-like protein